MPVGYSNKTGLPLIPPSKKGVKMSEAQKRKISKKLAGIHRSEETRKKMSKAKKGKPTGRKLSKQVRKKISESLKGEKSYRWKGGITKFSSYFKRGDEYKLWRKAVLERDYFTCQICGQRGGDLEVHHIFNFADYPERRTEIANGITLCKKCHKEFHKRYGVKNNTKEQLKEFLGR